MIEKYNKSRHNTEAVKELLAMAMGYPTPEKLQELLDGFYNIKGHTIFIVLDNGIISSIIGIDDSTSPCGFIRHLAVHPDNRMRGIGRNLINHVINTFALTSVESETDQDAVGFYRACGFQIMEIESRWPGVRRFRCSKDMNRKLC